MSLLLDYFSLLFICIFLGNGYIESSAWTYEYLITLENKAILYFSFLSKYAKV